MVGKRDAVPRQYAARFCQEYGSAEIERQIPAGTQAALRQEPAQITEELSISAARKAEADEDLDGTKPNAERGTLAGLAVYLNAAAVGFHDAVNQIQPYAGTGYMGV